MWVFRDRFAHRSIMTALALGWILIRPAEALAANCDEFLALIQDDRIEEVETALNESRTEKACAYHLAMEHLQRRDFDEAVKWINFARLFVNRDRDPKLYPLILYYMLLLDPHPKQVKAAYPAPNDYDAERDYNDLLGYGGDRIKEMAVDAKVAFVPEMRLFVRQPANSSCPEKSTWIDRLYLDWSEAEELCGKITIYEIASGERFHDPDLAERTLAQLGELGVNVDWVRQTFKEVEKTPTMEADSSAEAKDAAPVAVPPRRASAEVAEKETESPSRTRDVVSRDFSFSKAEAIRMLSFVDVPHGYFRMGCTTGDGDCKGIETPFTKVTISKPFRLAAYETTNAAFRMCVEAEVCLRPERSGEYGDPSKDLHPVVGVDWEQAGKFCEWLGGRLPTEAEWELAARGTFRGYRYPNGNSINHDEANYEGTTGKDRWDGTSPVGSFPPNNRGLYDMTGNVREWVADIFGNYSGGRATDPTGKSKGILRLTRGGGWDQKDADLRVSARHPAGPLAQADAVGFRCLLPAQE